MEKKKITQIIIVFILALSSGLSLSYYTKTKNSDLSIIKIEGDTWRELGIDYGRKCKNEIQGLAALLRELGDAAGLLGTSFEQLKNDFEPYIPDYLIEEMEGVAEGAGVDYMDILMINCFAEIMLLAASGGIACTQWAKLNGVSDSGPIFGRTLDFFPSFVLMNFNVYLVADIGGIRWIGQSIAGMVGLLAGMNDKGLVISISMVSTNETGLGIPMVLAIRHALQQYENVAEAEAYLDGQTHALGWNFFMMDKDGDAAILETTNKNHNTRWLNDEEEVSSDYMAATNDFHSQAMAPYCSQTETSILRKARAEQLMDQNDNFGVGDAIKISRDEYDASIDATNPGRNTICRKWIRKTFLPAGTLGTFIAVPKEGYCVVSNGYPDSALFYAVNLQGEVTGPIA